MMKKIIGLVILLYIAGPVLAQNNRESIPEKNIERLIRANENINKLQNGALLVRLKTNKRKIEALRKYGYHEKADFEQQTQDALNREIIQSFNDYFHHGKTYFFYSENSDRVRQKNFEEPFFLNEKLEVDSLVNFSEEYFLTAEFGHVMQDTLTLRDNVLLERSAAKGVRVTPTYWGGSNFHFGALIVMSDEFIQLRKPFPSFVRTYDSIPFLRRKTYKAVARLNEKINNYLFF